MPPDSDRPRNIATHSTAHYFLDALNETGIDYLFCNFGTDRAANLVEFTLRLKAGRA